MGNQLTLFALVVWGALVAWDCLTWICFCVCIFATVRCSGLCSSGGQLLGWKTSRTGRGRRFWFHTCRGTNVLRFPIWWCARLVGFSAPTRISRGLFVSTYHFFPETAYGWRSEAWSWFLWTRCKFFYLGWSKPLLYRLWPIPSRNLKEGSLLGHGNYNSLSAGFGTDYCRVLSCYAWKWSSRY